MLKVVMGCDFYIITMLEVTTADDQIEYIEFERKKRYYSANGDPDVVDNEALQLRDAEADCKQRDMVIYDREGWHIRPERIDDYVYTIRLNMIGIEMDGESAAFQVDRIVKISKLHHCEER